VTTSQSSAETTFSPDRIAHLLADRVLAVPPFQRSYSWLEEQVEEFWDDLVGALDSANGKTTYFLGTVVLASDEDEASDHVIDGQQRLATTTILLACIRDAFRIRNDRERADVIDGRYLQHADIETLEKEPRIKLNGEDRPYFDSLIIRGEVAKARIQSHVRIRDAHKLLGSRLDRDLSASPNATARLTQWVSFLANRVTILLIEASGYGDAFTIFETLNDRGKPLTVSDLLRNHLMSVAPNKVSRLQQNWQSALTSLGLTEEDDVFVTFIRQHWASSRGSVREKDLYREMKTKLSTPASVLGYGDELTASAEIYAGLLDEGSAFWNGWRKDIPKVIGVLNTLALSQFRPLALAVIDCMSGKARDQILVSLLNWTVRGVIVGGVGGGVAERAYSSAATQLRDGKLKSRDDILVALVQIVPSDSDFRNEFSRASISRPQVARYLLTALSLSLQGRSDAAVDGGAEAHTMRLRYLVDPKKDPSLYAGIDRERIPALQKRLGNLLIESTSGPQVATPASRLLAPDARMIESAPPRPTKGITEPAIRARQEWMAELAVATWPLRPA
jgi:hypothetical protein